MEPGKDVWKEKLTPEQYAVLREKGTEAPFTGALISEKRSGLYRCAACKAELFTSDTKFDSHSGWPSFDKAIAGAVVFTPDNSHGIQRTEVTCARCGSHLGHVFDDLPQERKGEGRYCINSVCLAFEEHAQENSHTENQ